MTDQNLGASFRQEGEPAFKVESTENDNSAESLTEKTDTDQNQSQEGDQNSGANDADKGNQDGGDDKGFADHPRWKEREADWTKRFNEQEQRHVDALEGLRKEFEEKYTPKVEVKANATGDAPSEPPSWFGGDAEQWAEFQKWNNTLIGEAEKRGADRALKEIETRSTAEQKAIDDATKYFNDEVSSIETDKTLNPNGLKVDRNKLLKTALDNDLIDSKGRWNYKAAFKMMKPTEVFQAKAALDEKKKIAGASTDETRADSKADNVTSSTDFKKPGARPW